MFKQFKPIAAFILICINGLLVGCSSVGLKIANIPSTFFDGEVKTDILFEQDEKLKLDIYTPKTQTDKQLPTIVFFYGGRWSYGDKASYKFAATALAEKGFVVVVPNYRKYPAVKFPAFVEDGAAAVQWTHQNIDQYGGSGEQMFIVGHSAGAHIGSLIVSDTRYLAAINGESAYKSIKGFVGLAGPYKFVPTDDDLKDMFGPPSQYDQMQTTSFIQGNEPPMLLLFGENDDTVKPFNAERLEAAIKQKQGEVQTIGYPDVNHIEIVGALSYFWRSKAPVRDDIVNFIQQQLKQQ